MATTQENIEFIDCSTISIQYDATGRASLSFTVVRSDLEALQKTYTNLTFGGVTFEAVIMSASMKPVVGSASPPVSEGWAEWQMQMQGVGN